MNGIDRYVNRNNHREMFAISRCITPDRKRLFPQ